MSAESFLVCGVGEWYTVFMSERRLSRFFWTQIVVTFAVAGFGLFWHANLAGAEETDPVVVSEELQDLQDEIDARKSQIDELNSEIDYYREKINASANKTAGLLNDIELIENQIALAELDVSATQIEIESQQLEVAILEERIRQETEYLAEQRILLEEILFSLNRSDDLGLIEILFGADDFHELFSQIEQLESLGADLQDVVEATKQTRLHLEQDKSEQEGYLASLLELEDELQQKLAQLDSQQGARETLLVATQESEAEYRILLSELRQEQSAITSAITSLQLEFQDSIDDSDELGDSSLFTMPQNGGIMTASFHDPTYPFRHLFEHSGIDWGISSGSPIMASAPGIVAWARTGRSYGNYVIIIHQGGFSTLYAHMSSLAVEADDFVSRGQVIGYSGNTGLSTGPHLHFEIRQNGIPVNPLAYLVGY